MTVTGLRCWDCGSEIAFGAPQELCTNCLLSLGLDCEREVTDPRDIDLGLILAKAHSALGVKFHSFGDYELVEEIARGGMGVVFRARQISLNRPVALKLILGGRLASPPLIKRFQVEAEAAASLHHRHIVAIHEIGEHDGHHYYSMELVEGAGLNRQIAAYRVPDPEALTSRDKTAAHGGEVRIASLMVEVADAVDYAHQHGVL